MRFFYWLFILLLGLIVSGCQPQASPKELALETRVAALETVVARLTAAAPSPVTATRPTPIATATVAPTPTQVTTLPGSRGPTLPYSWIEKEIEVTILGVRNLGMTKDSGGTYQIIIEVPLVFQNLAHEVRGTLGQVVAFNLALKTDRGNIYEDDVYTHLFDFKPEERKERGIWFRIRPDERPVELWQFKITKSGAPVSQQEILHVWKLE